MSELKLSVCLIFSDYLSYVCVNPMSTYVIRLLTLLDFDV